MLLNSFGQIYFLSKNPAFRLCMDKLLIHSNSNSNLLATGIMGLIPIIQIMVIPIMHLMRYFCPQLKIFFVSFFTLTLCWVVCAFSVCKFVMGWTSLLSILFHKDWWRNLCHLIALQKTEMKFTFNDRWAWITYNCRHFLKFYFIFYINQMGIQLL